MLFVVLIQNGFGLRDAWYVNGNNVVDAMKEASVTMVKMGICPAIVTVLPTKESRGVPYLFPNDPSTDVALALDFLRGYTRTVRLSFHLMEEMEKEDYTEEEQEAEQPTLQKMKRFLHDDTAE